MVSIGDDDDDDDDDDDELSRKEVVCVDGSPDGGIDVVCGSWEETVAEVGVGVAVELNIHKTRFNNDFGKHVMMWRTWTLQ